MSYSPNRDFSLEVSLGNVGGYAKINKFGKSTDVDAHITDIWDGADGATSTDVWLAPLAARTHTIASTAAADDEPAGTGARTIRVYGLTGWGAAEVSEIIELDGAGANAQVTANSYVIIHRMKCLTFGTGGTNAGIITATANVDGTITAAIQIGKGQTLMAIYGIPSTQTLQIKGIDLAALSGTPAATSFAGSLLVQENADQADSGFITKEEFLFTDVMSVSRRYAIPKTVTGPAIAKIQVTASKADAAVKATFDAYVVDN